MNQPLFWGLMLFIQLICLWLARRALKKQRSRADYYLADRSLGFLPLTMTSLSNIKALFINS